MSELGERFAREEMERDERLEMLIEDLGLDGPALEEYLRVHRQVEMRMMMDDLFRVLLECWSRETAYPSCQKDWSPNDPSYGQCAITAMLVHGLFGGTICGRNPDTANRYKLLVAKIAAKVNGS